MKSKTLNAISLPSTNDEELSWRLPVDYIPWRNQKAFVKGVEYARYGVLNFLSIKLSYCTKSLCVTVA